MISISENLKIVPLVFSPDEDLFDGDPTGDWIKCDGSVLFCILEGAGGTGTAAITLNQATDNAGAGSVAMAFRYRLLTTAGGLDTWGAWLSAAAAGVTPAAGAEKSTLVEVRHDELIEGNTHVSLTLTEGVDGAVKAAGFALVDNTHKGVSPPSVL